MKNTKEKKETIKGVSLKLYISYDETATKKMMLLERSFNNKLNDKNLAVAIFIFLSDRAEEIKPYLTNVYYKGGYLKGSVKLELDGVSKKVQTDVAKIVDRLFNDKKEIAKVSGKI